MQGLTPPLFNTLLKGTTLKVKEKGGDVGLKKKGN